MLRRFGESVNGLLNPNSSLDRGTIRSINSVRGEQDGGTRISGTSLSLFQRLGGSDALKLVIENFYDRLLKDEELAPFFENVTVARLKMHQVRFFTVAFGGNVPGVISGLDNGNKNSNSANSRREDLLQYLIKKHQRFVVSKGLNETHFDRTISHLVGTLECLHMDPALVAEAAAIVVQLRPAFENPNPPIASTRSSTAINADEDLATLLGGQSKLQIMVCDLSKRIRLDPELAPFFLHMPFQVMNITSCTFYGLL